jgi:hypothetical protein
MKSCITIMNATIIASLILISGCAEKKNTQTVPLSTTTPPRSEFIPPADSTISAALMHKWLSCNPLLDSLSYLYQDSFNIDVPTQRLKFQDDFSKAQDKICIRRGLTGGYAEYRWIMKAAGHPNNRGMLDSIGLKTF